jgi:hypothetical protein
MQEVVVEVQLQLLEYQGGSGGSGGGGGGAVIQVEHQEQLILEVEEVVEQEDLMYRWIRWIRYCYCKSTRISKYFSKSRNKHSYNITGTSWRL